MSDLPTDREGKRSIFTLDVLGGSGMGNSVSPFATTCWQGEGMMGE